MNNNIKKVLIISGALKLGGGQRQLMHLINLLDREKFQTSLYLFKNTGEHLKDLPSDVNLLNGSYNPSGNIFHQVKQLRKIIIHEKPDIIYSNLAGTNIPTLLSQRFIPKKFRVPQVVAIVNNPEKYSSSNIRMLNWLLPFADKVVACAEGIRSYIITNFKVPSDKVFTIHNSVDLNLVKTQSNNSVSHPWFKLSDPVLVTVARLAPQKGCEVLIKAFNLVNSSYPCYLLILGDGPERNKLELLVDDLGLSDRVDFLGFKEKSNAYVKKSDIFILSSRWEGMATVIIEAATVKIPIVATDAPYGSADVIQDGINGFIVPVDDHEMLAEQIGLLLKNKTLSRSFVDNAYEKVKNEFDANVMVSKYESLFKNLINKTQ